MKEKRDDTELIASLTRLLPQPTQSPAEGTSTLAPSASTESRQPLPGTKIGDILIEEKGVKPSDVREAAQQQRDGDPRRVGEILVEKGSVKPHDVLEALNLQQVHAGSTSESTIRVDVNQLDRLMLLNKILQFSENTGLLATSQRLNLLTTELQEGVMKTRMQPIGNICSKFPRTVCDVATACGKKVRIEMEAKETELDKTIIEAIKDLLTHIVRNSVDHGIETPDHRLAARP